MEVGMYCPFCDAQGLQSRLMTNTDGGVGYFCERAGDHKFNDKAQLKAMNPKTYKPAMVTSQQTIPPTGAVKQEVLLDPHLAEALKGRYGQNLNLVLTTVLRVMAQKNSFMVGEVDYARFCQLFETDITSASTLFGLCYERVNRARELDQEVKKLSKNPRKSVDGAVVIELDENAQKVIAGKAGMHNMTSGAFLSQLVAHAIKSNWV
jgi:hypothetical protein